MVGGQALDLAAEGTPPPLAQVRGIHRRKTGALLRVAVRVGALVGGRRRGARSRGSRPTASTSGSPSRSPTTSSTPPASATISRRADGDEARGKATYPAFSAWTAARAACARAAERRSPARCVRSAPRREPLAALVRHVVERAA